ncbi:centrosomal protein of 170 kDa protein B isoform X1 [Syngnathus acus]|uniref:centrosomal protein of 170 kDa protein B isoform X1 n=1 Tax=Syngnathus acus TaxID=161584 RepID=UPI001885BD4E|nr:centrosomal protein of 170 kDa protein B isoform X1 [Syngnathus acus]XP_037101025.1 centrosomal protein of 170 kDa protein B isoform X1 [Syngnathus acus]XP_037101026.1 centrosomal protein of 170 kDa protein B isoform X1 [Syngnathus acus]
MSVTSWFLVSSSGTRHRLPKEMIFVGREDCELMLQSRSVDKQHAVINYNSTTDQHLVKDLGSLNGTFVNDLRIPDQTYMTLKVSDILRFGYDSHVYVLEKSQHKVPEEALKHEKYTSQLQISLKASQGKKAELEKNPSNKNLTQEVPAPRPTPLYGQPSWWGEEDCGSRADGRYEPQKEDPHRDHPRPEAAREVLPVDLDFPGCLSSPQKKSVFPPYQRESSYFEIPTKDLQLAQAVEAELQEIPTKDTPPAETPPAVQSHASFTIEFDDCTPGKIKIKDHVTKFSSRHRKTPPPAKAADVMSSQSKVADWLVHSDVSMMRKRPTCDDVYSTKSDLAINIKSLKGHHHDDGTQSDSEDPGTKGRRSKSQHCETWVQPDATTPATPVAPESPPRPRSPVTDPSKQGAPERLIQQAFVIEFFDDNPRKKRSQSFTHNPAHADSYSALKTKLERRKGGERPASVHGNVAPTQQVTVPLKGPGGHALPQRSSSLKREQADAETSRSTSAIFVRPFGSVGKKSKLAQDFAQEFAAEFLKDSRPDSIPTKEQIPPPPMSAPPVMVAPPPSLEPSASSVTAPPPSHPPPPLSFPGGDPKGCQRLLRNEEEDSVSEAGTYTIDTDAHDQEVEDARNMIDQVFGVLDSPEYAGLSPGTPRPVIDECQDEHANVASCCMMLHDFGLAARSSSAASSLQAPEGPKWVSRWASLADSCAAPGSTPPQEDPHVAVQPSEGRSHEHSESESSHSSRTRRLLPQVPPEKADGALPSLLVRHEDQDGADRAPRSPRQQRDSTQWLSVGEEVDPDSLSDVSQLEDGPISKQQGKSHQAPLKSSAPCRGSQKSSTKSTIFYIGSEENSSKPEAARFSAQFQKSPDTKTPPTTVLIRHLGSHEPRRGTIKPNSSAPNLQTQNKDCVPTKDNSSLVRQESFTKARPSENVQVKKLPHISSHPSIRDLEERTEKLLDGESFLLDAAKFPSSGSGQSSKKGGSSSHVDDSFSGESDVDTASTVSQVSSKNLSVTSASKKRPNASLQKDKTSSVQQKGRQLSARERLSEKRRHQAGVPAPANKAEATKRFQMRRSAGSRGSLDLASEAQQASGTAFSDQETSRGKKMVPDNTKTPNVQVLTRSNSLSAPRPTRASMLRRARLGEASDNEGAETDRASQTSDHGAKAVPETKKLSRLDILALPRKRTDSFTTPSDNETSSSAGRSAFSNRNVDPVLAARKSSQGDARQTASRAPGKNTLTRTRSSGAKYPNSGVHPKHKNSDFSSSSDEDYKTSANATKAKRAAQPPRSNRTPASRSKSVSLETEEDEDRSDPYQNWSTHSAEIAKLSHDLAKDLAILAREIHDVAGDGDCPAATAVSAAIPGDVLDTSASAEEVGAKPHQPPSDDLLRNLAGSRLDANMNRAQWDCGEDTQQLSPLRHLSHAIRDNTDQLAAKLKLMFQNKEDVWEEIDKKIKADGEPPVLETSNQEISSIVTELRRVQRQLEVINWVVDPPGSLQPAQQNPRPASKEKKGRGGSGDSKQNGMAQKTRRHVL